EFYETQFSELEIQMLEIPQTIKWNYSYFPILLKTKETRENLFEFLHKHEIVSRRYFSPSLNTLKQFSNWPPCPNSENISSRVLCLPFHGSLIENDQKRVVESVQSYFAK